MSQEPKDTNQYQPHEHSLVFPIPSPGSNTEPRAQLSPKRSNLFNPLDLARFKFSHLYGHALKAEPEPEESNVQNDDKCDTEVREVPEVPEIPEVPEAPIVRQQRFDDEQIEELERCFRQSRYLTPDRLIELSASLRLTENHVKMWYKSRRRQHKVRINKKRNNSNNGTQSLQSDQYGNKHNKNLQANNVKNVKVPQPPAPIGRQYRRNESLGSTSSTNFKLSSPSSLLDKPTCSRNVNIPIASASQQNIPLTQQPQRRHQVHRKPHTRQPQAGLGYYHDNMPCSSSHRPGRRQVRVKKSLDSSAPGNIEPPSPSSLLNEPTCSRYANLQMASTPRRNIRLTQQPQQGHQMQQQPHSRKPQAGLGYYRDVMAGSSPHTPVGRQNRHNESLGSSSSMNIELPSPSSLLGEPTCSRNVKLPIASASHQKKPLLPLPQQRHQMQDRQPLSSQSQPDLNYYRDDKSRPEPHTPVGMQFRLNESLGSSSLIKKIEPPSPSSLLNEPTCSRNVNFPIASASHQNIPLLQQPQQGHQMQDQQPLSSQSYPDLNNYRDNQSRPEPHTPAGRQFGLNESLGSSFSINIEPPSPSSLLGEPTCSRNVNFPIASASHQNIPLLQQPQQGHQMQDQQLLSSQSQPDLNYYRDNRSRPEPHTPAGRHFELNESLGSSSSINIEPPSPSSLLVEPLCLQFGNFHMASTPHQNIPLTQQLLQEHQMHQQPLSSQSQTGLDYYRDVMPGASLHTPVGRQFGHNESLGSSSSINVDPPSPSSLLHEPASTQYGNFRIPAAQHRNFPLPQQPQQGQQMQQLPLSSHSQLGLDYHRDVMPGPSKYTPVRSQFGLTELLSSSFSGNIEPPPPLSLLHEPASTQYGHFRIHAARTFALRQPPQQGHQMQDQQPLLSQPQPPPAKQMQDQQPLSSQSQLDSNYYRGNQSRPEPHTPAGRQFGLNESLGSSSSINIEPPSPSSHLGEPTYSRNVNFPIASASHQNIPLLKQPQQGYQMQDQQPLLSQSQPDLNYYRDDQSRPEPLTPVGRQFGHNESLGSSSSGNIEPPSPSSLLHEPASTQYGNFRISTAQYRNFPLPQQPQQGHQMQQQPLLSQPQPQPQPQQVQQMQHQQPFPGQSQPHPQGKVWKNKHQERTQRR